MRSPGNRILDDTKFNYRSNCHRTRCVRGRQRKSLMASCSAAGVLLLRVSFCGEMDIRIRELAYCYLPAIRRKRVASVISFCLLKYVLVPNLPFLSPALGRGRLGYTHTNFFSCDDFCKMFFVDNSNNSSITGMLNKLSSKTSKFQLLFQNSRKYQISLL